MTATRIRVEWMTKVPVTPDGGSDYDNAEWRFSSFADIEKARAFARTQAARNRWRQTWIKTEHAPSPNAPDWQWERDYDADEIIEA